MRVQSFTTAVPVANHVLFDYLSNIEKMPEWATEFCQELKQVDGRYKMLTPMGELFFSIRGDAETGVIDMCTTPDGSNEDVLPTRVIVMPDGTSAYVISFFQPSSVSEEVYQQQCESLQREMENIRRRFS